MTRATTDSAVRSPTSRAEAFSATMASWAAGSSVVVASSFRSSASEMNGIPASRVTVDWEP